MIRMTSMIITRTRCLPPRQFRAHPAHFRRARNTAGRHSNYVRLNYIRHTANWNILYHTLLSTELFYEDAMIPRERPALSSRARGFSFQSFLAEHIHRYGGAVTLGYQLTQHVTLGLRYQYTQKDSDQPLRDTVRIASRLIAPQFLRRQLQWHENLVFTFLALPPSRGRCRSRRRRPAHAFDSQSRSGRTCDHQHGHANQFHDGARRQKRNSDLTITSGSCCRGSRQRIPAFARNDNGELEVPYIGLVGRRPARIAKELALPLSRARA